MVEREGDAWDEDRDAKVRGKIPHQREKKAPVRLVRLHVGRLRLPVPVPYMRERNRHLILSVDMELEVRMHARLDRDRDRHPRRQHPHPASTNPCKS